MRRERTINVFLLGCVLLCQGTRAAEKRPTSRPAADVPHAVREALGTASGHTILIVIRPAADTEIDHRSAVAELEEQIAGAVRDAGDTPVSDARADALLRDSGVTGLINAEQFQRLRAVTTFDRVLSADVSRHGARRTVRVLLVDGVHVGQRQTLEFNAVAVAGAEGDALTDKDDSSAIAALEKCSSVWVDELKAAARAEGAAGTVHLCIRPADARYGLRREFARELGKGLLARLKDAGYAATDDSDAPPARPALTGASNDPKLLPAWKRGDLAFYVTYGRQGLRQRCALLLRGEAPKPLWQRAATLDEWDVENVAEVPAANRAILAFAEAQVGQKVGNGECWTLAAEALSAAHSPKPGDTYVFGRALRRGEMSLPGDVIQFESCRFEGPGWWKQMGSPNHTAVVRRVLSPTSFVILEQNPGPVGEDTIDFRDLTSGSYKIYRPPDPE